MAGKVVHFDIPIDDGDRAVTFYNEVFDWGLEQWGQMDYWTTAERPGDGIGGALGRRETPDEGVTIYVGVDDIDATLKAIETAGGQRLTERRPIPGTGWMALFVDTEGNRVGLFQSDPTVPMPSA
jgi:predicted enzyme related to lactoylglutathione lyase